VGSGFQVGMVVLLWDASAEVMELAALAAGALPRRAAAPASIPPLSSNRRRLLRHVPSDGWSSRMFISISFMDS